jgi:KAP family P-loop domain
MNLRPSRARFLIALVCWSLASIWVWTQSLSNAPAHNWQWGNLLRPWEPISINTAGGQTTESALDGTYMLLPSPLALFANIFFLIYLIRTFRQQALWVKAQEKVRGAIHDAPIEDMHDDRLERAPLVRSLAQLFRNIDTSPPFAVALTAPWGVGKSSVLNMLKTELKGHAPCVYINPWHYPQDSQLLAALMTGICKEAAPPFLSCSNFTFRLSLFWYRVAIPHRRWILVAVSVLFFALNPGNWTAIQLTHDLLKSTRWQTMWHSLAQTAANARGVLPPTLQAWIPDSLQDVVLVLALLLFGHKSLKRIHTFSPNLTRALTQSAQWASKSMSLPDWSQHAGLRHQFAQDFKDITRAFAPQRLVLLIDDLDRCEPHQIAQTLATLNFVFTNQAPCFVVLAMDKNYVQHALGLAYKDMGHFMHSGEKETPTAAQAID